MTHKIFIGYSTSVVAGSEALMPQFSAAANLVDEKKIAADIAWKRASYLQELPDMPYTGTFKEVFLIDVKNEKRLQYVMAADKDKDTKGPVALRVRNYLLKAYPTAWSSDTHETRKPEAVFIGFNPRRFLKMLGIECSLPHIAKPLPPRMWYGNSDHRDIEEACCPSDFKRLTLDMAVKLRRPLDAKSAKAWDELLQGWTGPGVIPEKDAQLALELAAQLGFVDS